MLSSQKVASNKTRLVYDLSSHIIVVSSTTLFTLSTNKANFESNVCKTTIADANVDKGESIA